MKIGQSAKVQMSPKVDYRKLLRKLENIEGELVEVLTTVRENGGDKQVEDVLNEILNKLLNAELMVCKVGNIE